MAEIVRLQEHDALMRDGSPVEYVDEYNHLQLIHWDKPPGKSWGYYAFYKIGAEWIAESGKALVVTTKRSMEQIDFLEMFMTCFSSDLSVESFSKIYKIDTERPQIEAPALSSIVSPLIVAHFLGVVGRIKSLKRGYVRFENNLKKVKGHIKLLKNERLNIVPHRYDRVYCEYQEYTVDIPENRLLKKALLYAQAFINHMSSPHPACRKLRLSVLKNLKKFEEVSDEVTISSVGQIRAHKLFSEYSEAIRLAKMILQHFDYSIHHVGETSHRVTPFVLDMSLLYEHYVYGLLYEAYQEKIIYQFDSKGTGIPDFLYISDDLKAIMDAKYIPKYDAAGLDLDVIRQLSGYGRSVSILEELGYEEVGEHVPSVPCVIIYPKEGSTAVENPFRNKNLMELCESVNSLSMFYKICVPVPVLKGCCDSTR